jgi:hypothetical protein
MAEFSEAHKISKKPADIEADKGSQVGKEYFFGAHQTCAYIYLLIYTTMSQKTRQIAACNKAQAMDGVFHCRSAS